VSEYLGLSFLLFSTAVPHIISGTSTIKVAISRRYVLTPPHDYIRKRQKYCHLLSRCVSLTIGHVKHRRDYVQVKEYACVYKPKYGLRIPLLLFICAVRFSQLTNNTLLFLNYC
jgi:hypothetical protein